MSLMLKVRVSLTPMRCIDNVSILFAYFYIRIIIAGMDFEDFVHKYFCA